MEDGQNCVHREKHYRVPMRFLACYHSPNAHRIMLYALAHVGWKGGVDLNSSLVVPWLRAQGFKVYKQHQVRARKELVDLGWIMPSRLSPTLYFLNPHLFPSCSEDSTRHHQRCQEWDRGWKAFLEEREKGKWDFGEVEL